MKHAKEEHTPSRIDTTRVSVRQEPRPALHDIIGDYVKRLAQANEILDGYENEFGDVLCKEEETVLYRTLRDIALLFDAARAEQEYRELMRDVAASLSAQSRTPPGSGKSRT